LTTKVDIARGEANARKVRYEQVVEQLADATVRSSLHARECDALRIVSDILRESIKARVERLGTLAVQSVFGREDLRLELKMDLSKGQMTAVPMLASEFRGEEILLPVKDAKGGGLVNVVSFILQVVVLVLTRPAVAKTIFLDERFKNVRDEIDRVGELLQKLHEMIGLQFVVVTKERAIADAANRVFWMERDETGAATVRVE
jgi:hypothetical protein